MKQIEIKAEIVIVATIPDEKVNFPLGVYTENGTADIWIRGVDGEEGGIDAIAILSQEVIHEEDVLD